MVLKLHSVAHWCYLHHVPVIPRLIKGITYVVFNCRLPAECIIGAGTRLYHHGCCTGIHPDVEIGRDCNIYNQVQIGGGYDGPDGPPIHIIIGDRVNICAGAKVFCKGGILRVGDGSTIGANAVVLHDVPPNSLAVGVPARIKPKKRRESSFAAPMLVKRGASIGSGAVLLCGITIGENALIGAGSVVTRDVPAGATVAGNPARIVKARG